MATAADLNLDITNNNDNVHVFDLGHESSLTPGLPKDTELARIDDFIRQEMQSSKDEEEY